MLYLRTCTLVVGSQYLWLPVTFHDGHVRLLGFTKKLIQVKSINTTISGYLDVIKQYDELN